MAYHSITSYFTINNSEPFIIVEPLLHLYFCYSWLSFVFAFTFSFTCSFCVGCYWCWKYSKNISIL